MHAADIVSFDREIEADDDLQPTDRAQK